MKAEDMDEEDNVVSFEEAKARLATDGILPPSKNWLSSLEPGTVFLSRTVNSSQPSVDEWLVVYHSNAGYTRLSGVINELHIWADPVKWSRTMELLEILGKNTDDD